MNVQLLRSAIVLLFVLFAGNASAQTSVVAAYGATSVYQAPIWIAKDRGLFKKYGLDVELIQLTGARITAGLLSGSANFIGSSAGSTFLANLGSGDTLLVGTLLNKVPFDLVVTKKIQNISDVKGKVGALAFRTDFTSAGLRIVLKANGIDPDTDVTLVQGFGTDPERVAALVSGSADFALIDTDFKKSYEAAGLRQYLRVKDVHGTDFVFSGIFTTKSFAKSNPNTVLAYLKAMAEALAIMKSDRAGTIAVVAKYTNRKVEDIEPGYDYFRETMQSDLLFDQELVETCLQALVMTNPAAATADPKHFYDASFVQKLEAEGFFKQLRK